MVIAFSVIHYICTFIRAILNYTNPSAIAIHVPGESFNDILGRFIVFDHIHYFQIKGGRMLYTWYCKNETEEAYKVDRDHISES